MSDLTPSPERGQDASSHQSITSHTVISSAEQKCSCGRRFVCLECRRYWVSKRVRSAKTWLKRKLPPNVTPFSITLSIRTTSDWKTEAALLWSYWKELGTKRTTDKKGRTFNGLDSIVRGLASMHYLNKAGEWQTHIHCTLMVTETFRRASLIDTWLQIGGSYSDVQPTKSLGAWVRYSIAGDVPSDEEDRLALQRMNRGKHQVRRIGK